MGTQLLSPTEINTRGCDNELPQYEAFANVLDELCEQLKLAIANVESGMPADPKKFATPLQLAAQMFAEFPTLGSAVVNRAREFYSNIMPEGEWGSCRKELINFMSDEGILKGCPASMDREAAEQRLKHWIDALEGDHLGFRTIRFIHELYRNLRDDFSGWIAFDRSPVFARFLRLTLRLANDPRHIDAIGLLYFRLAEPQDQCLSDVLEYLKANPKNVWRSLKRFVERLRDDLRRLFSDTARRNCEGSDLAYTETIPDATTRIDGVNLIKHQEPFSPYETRILPKQKSIPRGEMPREIVDILPSQQYKVVEYLWKHNDSVRIETLQTNCWKGGVEIDTVRKTVRRAVKTLTTNGICHVSIEFSDKKNAVRLILEDLSACGQQ